MVSKDVRILAGLAAMLAMEGNSKPRKRKYNGSNGLLVPLNKSKQGQTHFVFDTGFEVYSLNLKNARRKYEAWKKENLK